MKYLLLFFLILIEPLIGSDLTKLEKTLLSLKVEQRSIIKMLQSLKLIDAADWDQVQKYVKKPQIIDDMFESNMGVNSFTLDENLGRVKSIEFIGRPIIKTGYLYLYDVSVVIVCRKNDKNVYVYDYVAKEKRFKLRATRTKDAQEQKRIRRH